MQEVEITFHQQVEELFVRLRGRGVAIPNRDWPLISDWAERQVPFSLIERLMVEGFKKRPDIGSIRYFVPQIEEELKKQAHLYTGTTIEQKETPPVNLRESLVPALEQSLKKLEDLFTMAPDTVKDGVMECGWRIRCLIDELESCRIDITGVEPELEAINDRLSEVYLNSMPIPAQKRLVTDTENSLSSYRSRVDAQVFQEMVKRQVYQRVKVIWLLPNLSLFYLI